SLSAPRPPAPRPATRSLLAGRNNDEWFCCGPTPRPSPGLEKVGKCQAKEFPQACGPPPPRPGIRASEHIDRSTAEPLPPLAPVRGLVAPIRGDVRPAARERRDAAASGSSPSPR